MAPIVAPPRAHVKSAFTSTATAVNAFSRWAADRMLAPAPAAETCDNEPGRYEPSVRAAWNHTGYRLGLDGVLAEVDSVFPDAPPRDHLNAAFDFGEGQHAGFSRYARRVGHDRGLDGKGEELPASIPGRFRDAFLLGHSEGSIERREREREMAAYFRSLDLERAFDERERDMEILAREAGGWDRVANRALI